MIKQDDTITVNEAQLKVWLLESIADYKEKFLDSKDAAVEANRQALLDRSNVGITKYGTTLTGNKGDLRYWLNHSLEECLDMANYLRRAIMEIDDKPKENLYIVTILGISENLQYVSSFAKLPYTGYSSKSDILQAQKMNAETAIQAFQMAKHCGVNSQNYVYSIVSVSE